MRLRLRQVLSEPLSGKVVRETRLRQRSNTISLLDRLPSHFIGNQQGIAEGENYVGNYEYREGDPVSSVLPGKIEQASEVQIQSKEFYLQTLEWQEDIWYLDDVVGGKRPRLQAEGDVYGTEENPVLVEAPEMIQEAIAVRSQEEAALSRSLEGITGYREDRKLLYENLQLFMPFYQREQIVLDGNHVDVSHILNQKRVLAVYPMDEQGRRIGSAVR